MDPLAKGEPDNGFRVNAVVVVAGVIVYPEMVPSVRFAA
jgi:hypothetical protein